jgi:hypothetical protein
MSERRVEVARIYAALWTVLVGAAALCVVVPGARGFVRAELALSLDGSGTRSAGMVAAIALHNVCIALWPAGPALLGLGHDRVTRRIVDVLLYASLIANGAIVGIALGACGPRLFPFVIQVPAEWLGLAAGAACWRAAARDPTVGRRARGCAPVAALATAAILVAAVLEVYATPH